MPPNSQWPYTIAGVSRNPRMIGNDARQQLNGLQGQRNPIDRPRNNALQGIRPLRQRQRGQPQAQLPQQPQQQQQAVPPGNIPSSNSLPADPVKLKLIHQQMALLVHAKMCMMRERENSNHTCNLGLVARMHCSTFKDVVLHRTTCRLAKNCPKRHCSSSRLIINHLNNCHRADCPVCLPFFPSKRNNIVGTRTEQQQPQGQNH